MKIVILDGYTENPGDLSWNGFEALGEVTVYDRTPFADGSGEIVRRAKGADILIVNKTPLSAETLAKLAPELRYIGVLATGYNVVDTAAAKAQGVPVCNIPTYGTAAVAQFVMALLLELCHHVGDHSLHCPLFPDTQGIINRESIAKMKDGVLLINTSRGPLIVEEDLAAALHSGKVAGAGLDVLAVEPARMDNPLLKEENCLVTPHIAWAPKESRQRLMDIAVENLKAFLAGAPQNVVNA